MAAQETTTPQPKERIIFDADSYYGTEGENMAVEDIMERYGITEEEVREQYSDEEIFDRAMEMRETDYEEETDALIGWFDGQTPGFTPAITDENSDWYGNPVIVSGSIGRWYGTAAGSPYTTALGTPSTHPHPATAGTTCSPTARYRKSGTRTGTCSSPGRTTTAA